MFYLALAFCCKDAEKMFNFRYITLLSDTVLCKILLPSGDCNLGAKNETICGSIQIHLREDSLLVVSSEVAG